MNPIPSEVFGEADEAGVASVCSVDTCVDVPGHSRNSSNTSHGSGYASINSQSDKSCHMRWVGEV